MAETPTSSGVNSTKFASLKETPEDLEQQAVTNTLDAAQDKAKEGLEEGLDKMLDDHLDDTLMPPLDMIVLGLQKAIPQIVKSGKAALDSFLSSLPFSAILHLVLIETLTLWIFYYSVINVFTNVIKEAALQLGPTDQLVPPAAKVDLCLSEYARRIMWNDGHMSEWDCWDAATVEGPYEDTVDDTNVAWTMSYINIGCLILCISLWLVVFFQFCWHSSCRLWLRYSSGTYLKCSFITRRSVPYRLTCGLIGICGVLSIGVSCAVCMRFGILGWFLSSQLMNLLVVLTSARSFLAPTKPKFEYSKLHELTFKRSTFFQTNGGFAVKLSDALIQSARGSQFRGPLIKLLARKEDWELALRICFVGENTSGSGNKALLKLWGAAQDHLPTAISSVQEHGPTALNAVKAQM